MTLSQEDIDRFEQRFTFELFEYEVRPLAVLPRRGPKDPLTEPQVQALERLAGMGSLRLQWRLSLELNDIQRFFDFDNSLHGHIDVPPSRPLALPPPKGRVVVDGGAAAIEAHATLAKDGSVELLLMSGRRLTVADTVDTYFARASRCYGLAGWQRLSAEPSGTAPTHQRVRHFMDLLFGFRTFESPASTALQP